ncbi:uncharacterized protein SCHCODRAFT_02563174 [Schizophyllum commune H4-8]|uniref:Expressed protein n=1 Tax=Schizophyllum commune (strain H4-8 / FGSC 9210) TaxID=578458 RepID=D8PV63_SCHCM|nr:uncharacterized protein SCHCODRAFT_02563174 [Schizophyllum commune H4-8]KAI5900478.1 hypothetical protein SCHCODRAFT_02563174 [Schizophyllum commune H4-8]
MDDPTDYDADQTWDSNGLVQSRVASRAATVGKEGCDSTGGFSKSQIGLNEDRQWVRIQWIRPL